MLHFPTECECKVEIFGDALIVKFRHIAGITGHEDIGHDSTAAINDSSAHSRIFQRIGQMNTVGIIELTFLVTMHNIQFIIVTVSHRIGFLYTAPRRRIITRHRKTQCRPVVQFELLLHQTFPETATTHNCAAVIILNSSRENLRCRSRPFIDKHYNFVFLEVALTIGVHIMTRRISSFCINNFCIFGKELIHHLTAHLHIAAAIAPEIEQIAFSTLRLEPYQSCEELIIGVGTEIIDFDITGFCILHILSNDAVKRDVVTQHIEVENLGRMGTPDTQFYFRSFLSAQGFENLIVCHTDKRGIIYCDNTIAWLNAHLLGRPAGNYLHNHHRILLYIELDTHP